MKTKKINIGGVHIGGGEPIKVQSMTNTITSDIKKTVLQIKRLEKAGCELIRVAIPDIDSALAIRKIKDKIKIPLIADIHFDYKLAILAIENGADKIRINPGNIGGEEKVLNIIKKAKEKKIPIRIGINSGSLQKNIKYKLKFKSKNDIVNKMVASLMEHIEFFEKNNFFDIVVSLKSSDVLTTIEAYKLFSKYRNYPLHIGITEAGTELGGVIKSSIGIGVLLHYGLGDTIRVSLSSNPEKEVYVAYRILDNLGLRKRGVEIISCPTCARSEVDVIKLASKIEKITLNIKKPLKIAVMGCVVNGPGEAKEADLGITANKKTGFIFKYGKIIKKVKKENMFKEFEKELKNMLK